MNEKIILKLLWHLVSGFIRKPLRKQPFSRQGLVDYSVFSKQIQLQKSRGAKIGKKVRLIGRIDGINPHLVSIGDYSIVGAQSALLAHCPIRGGLPCCIGELVYVGFNAIILPGVTVGDCSVIGAGAVVTKDVPAGSIVAGNPARLIRPLTSKEKAKIKLTMREGRLFGWDENQISKF